MVCTIDLPASLAALAGASVPADAFPDSFDLSGALLGRAGAAGRDHLIQQDNGQAGNFGFREGKWKLVRHDSRSAYHSVVERPLGREPVPQFQLFDLEAAPGETRHLSAAPPAVGGRLQARPAGMV